MLIKIYHRFIYLQIIEPIDLRVINCSNLVSVFIVLTGGKSEATLCSMNTETTLQQYGFLDLA